MYPSDLVDIQWIFSQCMSPSNLVDIPWIFSQCMYPLARLSIEYYLDVSIGLGGYPVDIHSVYVSISQIEYCILYGCIHQIRQISSGYSLSIMMD